MPRTRPRSKTTTKVVRWYLSGGDEECPYCGQLYAYELEFRCPDCDSPSCPHCKSKHADERYVCPGCVAVIAVTGEGASHGG